MKFSTGTLLSVPLTAQLKDYTCGVAATRSILRAYGKPDPGEAKLARMLRASPETGTSYKDIMQHLSSVNLECSAQPHMNVSVLRESINVGFPVILLLQAWHGRNPSYQSEWADGHFVVAAGYNDRSLVVMDPSTQGTYAHVPWGELYDRWHDVDSYTDPNTGEETEETLHNFGITISALLATRSVYLKTIPKMR